MTYAEKKETMGALVLQWKNSGLSQAQFADQNGITLVKFRYWVKKLKEPGGNEPGFVQLNGFMHQTILLRYPNGVELRLPGQTPVAALHALIHFPERCSR